MELELHLLFRSPGGGGGGGGGGSCALREGGSCALGEGVHVPSGSSILSSCYSISNCDHF